ncbi:TIGR00304 family protein [Methanomethylovorans sp.]|uniref:TIGR00304 family membrane protein n=1 Tax=Methanomethylovorans sp. TaxID=2758717 RepID=UPI00351C5F1E
MVAQLLISMGILSIFIGFILVFIGNFMSSGRETGNPEDEHTRYRASDSSEHICEDSGGKFTRTEVQGGGIIMLGPIPIILGTDSKSTLILILLAIVLMLMAFFLFR